MSVSVPPPHAPDGPLATCLARIQQATDDLVAERYAQAERGFDELLQAGIAHATLFSNRGVARQRQFKLSEARSDYECAIALAPGMALAHANLGVVCMELGDSTAALASLRQAVHLEPEAAMAHANLGNALLELDQPEAALMHYQHALALEPNDPTQYLHLGLVLLRLDRPDAAADALQQALTLDPQDATLQCYLGECYRARRLWNQALDCYAQALSRQPGHAASRYFSAQVRLARGEWHSGWRLYEARWDSDAARLRRPALSAPLWLGQSDIRGQRLLVHCEQGFGDVLMFCRYLRPLQDKGAELLLQAPLPLLRLLCTLPVHCTWLAPDEPLPVHDWQIPLLSLPLALNSAAPLRPEGGRYLPLPPAADIAAVRAPGVQALRIGLACSGNALHHNDRHRRIALERLLACLPAHCAAFVLQTDLHPPDRATLERRPDVAQPLAPGADFFDSARWCATMDLIISVDTSLAHLAGALGKPVWVLLPWNADWRWGQQASECHWYPTARLYRQQNLSDWDPALEQIRQDLQQFARDDLPR